MVLGMVAAIALTGLALGVSAWSVSGPGENPPTRPFWNLGHRHVNGQQCPEQPTDPGTSRGTEAGQGQR